LQSRSKQTQPRAACLPFVSVISELREIIAHQKKAASRLFSIPAGSPSGFRVNK